MRIAIRGLCSLALSVSLIGVCSVEARGSTISWGYQGAVNSSNIADIPVGTPVNMTWSFDSAQPDACAGTGTPGQGIYFGQTVTLAMGGLTYVSTGIFTNNTNVSQGCGGGLVGTELRLIQWSGPNLPGLSLIPFFPCCTSPAIVGIPATADGSLPSTQPASLFVQGPLFGGGVGVTSTVQTAPEPSTIALVGTALLAMLRKRRVYSKRTR